MNYKILDIDVDSCCITFEYEGEVSTINVPFLNKEKTDLSLVDEYIKSLIENRVYKKLEEGVYQKFQDITAFRRENVGFVLNCPVDDLLEKQLQIFRLTTFAMIALKNPMKYAGKKFNGQQLPDIEKDIVATLNTFLEKTAEQSILIEYVIERFDDRMKQLVECRTYEEVSKVNW